MAEGKLVVKASTSIVISNSEDRVAAATLQQEIQDRVGIRLAIEVAGSAPAIPGHISLARLSDRGLREYLESQGVQPNDLESKDFAKQGYVMIAGKSGVIVAGTTGQGVFYGTQTLRQLLHQEGKSLAIPALMIRDWPSMELRGVSDDISRGPIPTLDYLKFQIRTLAEYKVNLLGLNMENVFDFQSQPIVPPEGTRGDVPALTPGEVRELVAYAGKYFITLLPEQQAFGHLHQFLKYEIYSDIAETPHGHVLTPSNSKSYELIRRVYEEVVPLFPGPFFHVGADETVELGQGQTKSLVDKEGLGQVYLEHLQQLFEIMRPYHKRLLFWGDIALKYPELLSKLPKDMIAVPWEYNAQPSYENIITPYTNTGLRVIIAPGVSNWGAIWPDFDVAFHNIRDFVRDGQKHQALGLLNTIWHDDGETLTDMTWPGLVFGAAAGWQPGTSDIDIFKESYDWAFYRMNGSPEESEKAGSDSIFRDVIENLDRSHTLLAALKVDKASNERFWSDPFTSGGSTAAAKALPATHDLRLSAEHAIESLGRERRAVQLHRETLDDLRFAAWRLDALGMKIQFTSEINHYYWDAYQNQSDPVRVQQDLDEIIDINGRLESLRDAVTQLKTSYEQAWARENHPYWLENVLVRYDHLASECQAKIVAVQDAERAYDATKVLPAPEQLGFFLKP